MGLTFDECLLMPFGYLLTLINIDALKHGASEKISEEEEFMRIWRSM